MVTPPTGSPRESDARALALRDAVARDHTLRAQALRAANGRSHTRTRIRAPRLTFIWDWAKVFPAAVLLFLVLRTFFVEAYKIPSGSMERTLLVGDFLLVNKLVYGAGIPFTGKRMPAVRAPRVGDVVVFEYPVDPSKNFVKRLVGMAGDTLAMRDGVLERNGKVQQETYVEHTEPGIDPVNDEFFWQRGHLVKTAVAANASEAGSGFAEDAGYRPSRNNWGPLVVPAHHFFVLGDNRDNSLDSRYWGFVSDTLLRGTPLVVYYSFEPDSASAVPWLTRIRWARIGSAVR